MFNYVRSLLTDAAQTHYLVDSDFRTVAQGWARADGTGPLDLWAHRNPGYVIRTGDYADDTTAWNAARDLMVDFRGDTLFLPPCALSLGTITTWDVPYARIMGSAGPSNKRFGCSPRVRNTSITLGVAQALTLGADADGLEMANIRFVPLTGAIGIQVALAATDLHFHDFMWDCRGITGSTATIFLNTVTTANAIDRSCFDHFTWYTDTAGGPVFDFNVAGDYIEMANFLHMHVSGGTLVNSLLDHATTLAFSIVAHDGRGINSTAAASAVTRLAVIVAPTGSEALSVSDFYGSVGYSTATGLVSATATVDYNLSRCFISTIGAGLGETLYTA